MAYNHETFIIVCCIYFNNFISTSMREREGERGNENIIDFYKIYKDIYIEVIMLS